jgi:hypothetical protein
VAREGSAGGEQLLDAVEGGEFLVERGPPFEGAPEGFDSDHPVEEVALEHPLEDLLERVVDDPEGHQGRDRTGADLVEGIVLILALEGVVGGEGDVEHQRQGPGVVSSGGPAGLEPLGGGVLGESLGAA